MKDKYIIIIEPKTSLEYNVVSEWVSALWNLLQGSQMFKKGRDNKDWVKGGLFMEWSLLFGVAMI